jgi:hypothetical protein
MACLDQGPDSVRGAGIIKEMYIDEGTRVRTGRLYLPNKVPLTSGTGCFITGKIIAT